MRNYCRAGLWLFCVASLLVGCTRFTGQTTSLPPVSTETGATPPSGSTAPTPKPGSDQPISDMTWTLVANAEKRGAVCNDGSPAGYYIRRGVGAGSTTWDIHLQGGGLCYDLDSCGQRSNTRSTLMS